MQPGVATINAEAPLAASDARSTSVAFPLASSGRDQRTREEARSSERSCAAKRTPITAGCAIARNPSASKRASTTPAKIEAGNGVVVTRAASAAEVTPSSWRSRRTLSDIVAFDGDGEEEGDGDSFGERDGDVEIDGLRDAAALRETVRRTELLPAALALTQDDTLRDLDGDDDAD